ncbi:MAG: metal-dependent transcriptional regulator [Oscillospiraceae bacterium]
MENNKKVTSSLEDYLETIFILQTEKNAIRVTDIALALGVSKPSVNHAVSHLISEGYIEHESYGDIILTPSGETYAANILRRHKMIKHFLVNTLGVNDDLAEEDACRMEHVMSSQTIEKLYEYLDKN